MQGARPGDLLEVEFVDIVPQPWAFTAIMPGLGFLRDVMTTPFLVHWDIADGWATSRQLPNVRIPGAPFMGVSGVAPSRQQVEAWTRREADWLARGGMVLPPDAGGAVPASGPAATHGLRTLPPRENGGNFDVKQLSKGSRLFLPVAVDGALFSTGDGHFAQGDGEVCVTAVEMGATCVVRFRVHRGEAERRGIRWPRFARSDYFIDPRWAAPQRFIATMGMPVDEQGVNQGENLNTGLPERHPEHDGPAAGARLLSRAGLRALQRRRRPPDQQRGGRAQLRRLRVPARGHLLELMGILRSRCR